MMDWFRRFRHYPVSVLGHILWGVAAGWVGGLEGLALLSGGYAYQFGSAWRKQRERHKWQTAVHAADRGPEPKGLDTVGLDAFDYAVGFAIGCTVQRFVF